MERVTITVRPEQAGRTVKSLMLGELSMSKKLLSSAKFRPGGILLNGAPARTSVRVRPGDKLSVSVADRRQNAAVPIAMALSILWEDDALLLLDKPAGVSVYGGNRPNLAGIFAEKWGPLHEFHPVNRLDVGTSGLMVVAKDGYTHDRLRRLLHTEYFRREYLAVAQGALPPGSGFIDLPLSRAPVSGLRRAVDPAGLPCRTEYELLAQKDGRSVLRLRLYTGRTHQIRAHLAAIGHPLVGDRLYGADDLPLPRPALHSRRVFLRHPITGETIDVTAPVPEDILNIM